MNKYQVAATKVSEDGTRSMCVLEITTELDVTGVQRVAFVEEVAGDEGGA